LANSFALCKDIFDLDCFSISFVSYCIKLLLFLSKSKDSIRLSALIPARCNASSFVFSYSSIKISFSFPLTYTIIASEVTL